MTQSPDVQSTLDDHKECMEAVARVESCLDGRPDTEWLERLKGELGPMLETLRCHFSQEAEGSMFTELPVLHPRFAPRLEALLGEHGEIVRRTQQILDRADSLAGAEPHQLREFAAAVHLLVATIRRHEAEENEIVIETYWLTLGSGD